MADLLTQATALSEHLYGADPVAAAERAEDAYRLRIEPPAPEAEPDAGQQSFQSDRLRSFLIGGVVGASAMAAAARRRRRRRRRRPGPRGLAAFEDAPCYREIVEAEEEDDDAS